MKKTIILIASLLLLFVLSLHYFEEAERLANAFVQSMRTNAQPASVNGITERFTREFFNGRIRR